MTNNLFGIVPLNDAPERDYQPDPGPNGAKFLGWLSKRGSAQHIKRSLRQAQRYSLDLNKWCKDMGDKVKIRRSPGKSGGEKYVFIEDDEWSEFWKIHYDEVLPHHSEQVLLKPSKK